MYVLPEKNINLAQVIIQTVRFLDTQERPVVFIHLPLVCELVHDFPLFRVVDASWVKILVDVTLSNRNVVLQVQKEVLVNVVIHLIIHTLDHMISDIILQRRNNLV